jgi:hypothetical protein
MRNICGHFLMITLLLYSGWFFFIAIYIIYTYAYVLLANEQQKEQKNNK